MNNSNIKILVLDDDTMVRENLNDYLEDEGFFVKSFIDAETALTHLINETYHLAIVDMRLPGIDGNTFILKSHSIDPCLKYIIHTGSSNYNLIDELIKIGIDPNQVYIKPVSDMSLLVNKIHELLHS
ncbi:MAG TPA: two-component system response regulator [Spirochaetia bacterium]|nr:two-component system response regulator [Spirochaetia bacterium]HBI37293.1 two-component system response regulator [Spirochaetia bacterium]